MNISCSSAPNRTRSFRGPQVDALSSKSCICYLQIVQETVTSKAHGTSDFCHCNLWNVKYWKSLCWHNCKGFLSGTAANSNVGLPECKQEGGLGVSVLSYQTSPHGPSNFFWTLAALKSGKRGSLRKGCPLWALEHLARTGEVLETWQEQKRCMKSVEANVSCTDFFQW